MSHPLTTHQHPLTNVSVTYHRPEQDRKYNNFGMLFFSVDSTVVYLFSDVYVYITDCLEHIAGIISFKLTKILLETTLSMTQQLQYWCCKIGNVIQSGILWKHSLDPTVTVSYHIDVILDTIGYICILCIIVDVINVDDVHKLHINSSCRYKLHQNGIVYRILSRIMSIMVIIKDCNEFDENVNKIDHIYQIAYKMNNFDLIISIINVSDIMQCQIGKLDDIFYAVMCGKYSFIRIDYIIPQAAIYIVMLLFKFNIGSHYRDLLVFYSKAMKMDDFHLMIAVINSINTIIVQTDYRYVILIVIMNELLVMVMDIFKLFWMSCCNNFSIKINIVENWFFYIVFNEKVIFHVILLITIVMACQFYIILCMLIFRYKNYDCNSGNQR